MVHLLMSKMMMMPKMMMMVTIGHWPNTWLCNQCLNPILGNGSPDDDTDDDNAEYDDDECDCEQQPLSRVIKSLA